LSSMRSLARGLLDTVENMAQKGVVDVDRAQGRIIRVKRGRVLAARLRVLRRGPRHITHRPVAITS
jgi:hypothetical protein